MCHRCTNANDQMNNGECNPSETSGVKLDGSQKPLEVKTQQGSPDVSSLSSEPPVGNIPTASLTVCESFGSTCSDLPVDHNLDGRDNQSDCQSNSGQDDLRYTQNGHLKKSSSEINGNPEYSIDGCSDEEAGEPCTYDDPAGDEIWIPPPAENEDSLATFDDDDEDEGYADGVKWGKPSSLSSFEEDINRLKEEKDKALEEVMTGKFRTLVSQLLKTVGIVDLEKESESWVDIVSSLAWQAAIFVKPDATEGKPMDPAGYVKIKCIPTGSRTESKLVKGLVFKKHAAHKHMPTKYTKPKLMLIQGMLGHSSGLSSFNSMIVPIPQDKDKDKDKDIMQNKDNMSEDVRSLLEKLEACHPNVVLLEKSAPRDVLEAILKMGVTLVVDMKLHRLERIARCTGSPIWSADIMPSQNLKQCDSLYFEKFAEEHAHLGEGGKKPHKTLMFLEGSPTRLGCTILLKGSHSQELKKIKCVLQCAVVMAYHFFLETSFLMDQEVMFSTIVSDGGATKRANESSNITSDGSHNEEIEAASAERTSISLSNGFHEGHDVKSALSNGFHEGHDVKSAISNGFHEGHDVKSAVLSIDQNLSPGSIGSNFDKKKDVSLESNLPNGTDTDKPNKLNSQSEYKAVIQNVIGTLVSPADQYMQPFLHLSEADSDPQTENSVSAPPPTEATGQSGADSNGHLNDENLIDTHNNTQSLSSSIEFISDSQKTGSDSDDCNGRKGAISSVLDSESMLVLMSSRNALSGTVCEQSHFSHIKFYRNFDVPLGKFLQDNVLNESVHCKACGELPEAHFYYYAHHNKQLTIRVKRIPVSPLPGDSDGKLWMWSRCGKCKPEKEGNINTTKRVLISSAARGLSFGKFLELSFSNHSSFNRLSNCGHSLHRDFLYFFGLGNMVAMFRYSPVTKYTVSLPPQKLEFKSPIKGEWLHEETQSVYTRAMLFFTEVSGYMKKIETKFSGLTLNINGSIKEFIDIEKMLAAEKFEFEENIKNTCIKNGHSVRKLLSLNRLRWELFLEACIWNRRLSLLLSSASAAAHSATISKTVEEKPNVNLHSTKEAETTSSALDVEASQVVSEHSVHKVPGNCTDIEVEVEVEVDHVSGRVEPKEEENAVHLGSITGDDVSSSDIKNPALSSSQEAKDPTEPFMEPLSSSGSSHTEDAPIADHVLTQTKSAVVEEPGEVSSNSRRSSNIVNSRKQRVWNPFSEIREECRKDLCNKTQLPTFLDSLRLHPPNSPESLPTIYQIVLEEGSKMQIPLCDEYFISDYEGEISSILACAEAFMNDTPQQAEIFGKDDNDAQSDEGTPRSTDESSFLARAISEPYSRQSSSSTSSDSDMIHPTPSMSLVESRFSSFDGLNLLASLAPSGNSHQEVSLGTERFLGKPKYSVICLYANEFRALRNLCCPSELDYIASLSRCRNWDAKGGKSKSFFAKTLDDRLIIKEIKRTELESFMKFAPDYFQYMKQSFEAGNQTCLAKILGIHQVTIRQPKTGKEVRHDLMVMENLSFGRNISRQYDLKGALHARYTANADISGDVLLDQNFVNDMNQSPLYVGQKAKRLLQRAVWNDTTFLNRINVMDYSLLVGVDREGKELVCGIIDYLRQYTWDKQLETWVKSSLVVPKNVLPTIISPKEYKKRFRKFMDIHFLTVPDLWCSRRSLNPCKLCGIGVDHPSVQPKPEKQESLNNVSHAS